MIVGIERLYLSPLREKTIVPKPSVELVKQLKEVGQLQPVIVRADGEGKYEILLNSKTWVAVQRAGFHEVLISAVDGIGNEEAARLVNIERRRDPISEAEWFYSQLERSGLNGEYRSIAKLADSLELSRSYISHSIRLLQLSDSIKSAIREGTIEVGHAKILLGIENVDEREKHAKRVIDKKLSTRNLVNAVRRKPQDQVESAKAEISKKPPEVLKLERDLTGIVGSAVEIDMEAGSLNIDYGKNYDILDGILKRLGYVSS